MIEKYINMEVLHTATAIGFIVLIPSPSYKVWKCQRLPIQEHQYSEHSSYLQRKISGGPLVRERAYLGLFDLGA